MARSSRSAPAAPDAGAWISTAAGAHLRGRVTRDTAPEIRLRKAVHALGLRYRLNRRVARFKPDFVLPRYRLAVFVDGCYWHNCPAHGPTVFRGPNADRWRTKIAANVSRDALANEALAAAGWRVLRVWECQTRTDVEKIARSVVDFAQMRDQLGG